MTDRTLILASASPRRREILENLGYAVRTGAVPIGETPLAAEAAEPYVLRMAQQKNRAALAVHGDSLPLLSADTTVALDGRILGKPESADHARSMLRALSGRSHQVLTAVCVHYQGREHSIVQSSDVRFKALSDSEIERYIAGGEPMDKAGAYGIQGAGGIFVSHLAGSFTGVMGLPVYETVRLLQHCGAAVPPFA